MNFKGNFDELKERLGFQEIWRHVKNHYQVRLNNGVIVNWNKSTGTISLQGKGPAREVKEYILKILEENEIKIEQSPSVKKKNKGDVKALKADNKEVHSDSFPESELVIGLVAAVGTELKIVEDIIKERLDNAFNYQAVDIHVSRNVIDAIYKKPAERLSEFARISHYMDQGNNARKKSGYNSILALVTPGFAWGY